MPELYFKGKEFVHNHHLSVPYRPLMIDQDKSLGDGGLDDNLIIHGDNLHALKALLPRYAGKVDCVFIDPPYNTGNENWCYNDNVNNPVMKEWLSSNPVNKEDMLKHDKWCAMMWPRIMLLRELLSETGSIWMTLDENEIHRARSILDEIFGENNFVDTVIWHKNYAPKATVQYFSSDHDYLVIYAKNMGQWKPNLLSRTEEQDLIYKNLDGDPRGRWRPNNLAARNYYSKGTYSITCPGGREISGPPPGSYWRVSEEKFFDLDKDGRIWWGEDGNNVPAPKIFLSEVREGRVPQTIWHWSEVGHTQDAKKELLSIMSYAASGDVFITPKPSRLIERIIELATGPDAIILDSFAGSGTTAHATIAMNQKDDGNRKFILVECEDYADTLTAERVRRVMQGYEFQGTKKEQLLREKINFSTLGKPAQHQKLMDKVQALENIHGETFDAIKKQVKDDHLTVTGETKITDRVDGLGGSFTFCTLGDPINMDDILTGEHLPDYQNLGAWLFHTATGEPLEGGSIDEQQGYLGESSQFHVWLVYKPDLDYLKSRDAALTLDLAERIASTKKDKKHLVFAPARFVPNKTLLPMGVEHLPLPYALYRVNNA